MKNKRSSNNNASGVENVARCRAESACFAPIARNTEPNTSHSHCQYKTTIRIDSISENQSNNNCMIIKKCIGFAFSSLLSTQSRSVNANSLANRRKKKHNPPQSARQHCSINRISMIILLNSIVFEIKYKYRLKNNQ
jgi:hypothetical protein